MERALVIYPDGGLGNRLRAVASGWLLARACDRAFYLNWELGHACGVRWSDLFQNPFLPHPATTEELRSSGALYHDDGCARLPDGTAEAVAASPHPVIGIRTNQLFRPPGCGDFRAARGAFYRSLRPVAAVEDAVCRFIGCNDVGQMIGVHIRRGDLMTDRGGDTERLSPIGGFIDRCRMELESRRARGIFLATDSARDERRMRRAFGPLVHSCQERTLDRHSVAGMRDALIDWLLLSRTIFLIRSYYTSFSKEACAVHGIGSSVILREPGPLSALLAGARRILTGGTGTKGP